MAVNTKKKTFRNLRNDEIGFLWYEYEVMFQKRKKEKN